MTEGLLADLYDEVDEMGIIIGLKDRIKVMLRRAFMAAYLEGYLNGVASGD